jgi:hypothetical protein
MDELELYALARLPEKELVRLEEHLIVCPTCRCGFEEIEDYVVGMREILMADARTGRDSGWDLLGWLRRPAVTMTLAFVALLAAMALLSRGPAQVLPSTALQIPARELDVTIGDALRDIGPFRVQVLNPAGQTVWSGLAESGPRGVEVRVQQPMTPGDYFLRLYSVSGEKLKEYGFRVGS